MIVIQIAGVDSDLGWTSDSSTDYDDDGCQDATDEDGDDDNDGVSDSLDSCSTGDLGWTSDENTDYDGDGCQDDSTEDLDDDNDGALDDVDSDDNNIYECSDNDQDGCEDCLSGSYNINDDGPDADGDGQCDIGDADLVLHENANLISFYALPENGDYSIENIFGDLGDNIQKILGESQVALNLGDQTWVGSLDDVAAEDGYWVVLDEDSNLEVQGLPTAPVTYGLHTGNNLVSYSYAYSQDINGAFSDDSSIEAVYGEGSMAANINGSFEGSLSSVDPGSGYWVVASSPFTFEYNEPTTGGARLASDPIYVPEQYQFAQSVNQYFYFVTEATIQDVSISEGDWIVAYNNDVVVGSRMYKNGGMIDVPIMGYDESTQNSAIATAGYCKKQGDTPIIKVHRINGDVFEMDVETISGTTSFQNIGHSTVVLTDNSLPNEVALHSAYPNPFNPSTMIEYDIPSEMHVNLSVYDIRGRLVAELVNDFQAGSYDAYKVIWNADMQSSGVYFISLTAGNSVKTQKVMLLK